MGGRAVEHTSQGGHSVRYQRVDRAVTAQRSRAPRTSGVGGRMTPRPPKDIHTPTQDPVNAGVRSLPYLGEPNVVTRVFRRGTRSQEEGDVQREAEAGTTCPERGCSGHGRLEKASERILPSKPLGGTSSANTVPDFTLLVSRIIK